MTSVIRWIVLRVTTGNDGHHKATEVLGELAAPDKTAALAQARGAYRGAGLSVVSKLSWQMSQEELRRLDKHRIVALRSAFPNQRGLYRGL